MMFAQTGKVSYATVAMFVLSITSIAKPSHAHVIC